MTNIDPLTRLASLVGDLARASAESKSHADDHTHTLNDLVLLNGLTEDARVAVDAQILKARAAGASLTDLARALSGPGGRAMTKQGAAHRLQRARERLAAPAPGRVSTVAPKAVSDGSGASEGHAGADECREPPGWAA